MFNQINVQVEARPDPETASLLGKHFLRSRMGGNLPGRVRFLCIYMV